MNSTGNWLHSNGGELKLAFSNSGQRKPINETFSGLNNFRDSQTTRVDDYLRLRQSQRAGHVQVITGLRLLQTNVLF
jgi:hypothetical protein